MQNIYVTFDVLFCVKTTQNTFIGMPTDTFICCNFTKYQKKYSVNLTVFLTVTSYMR